MDVDACMRLFKHERKLLNACFVWFVLRNNSHTCFWPMRISREHMNATSYPVDCHLVLNIETAVRCMHWVCFLHRYVHLYIFFIYPICRANQPCLSYKPYLHINIYKYIFHVEYINVDMCIYMFVAYVRLSPILVQG